MTQTNNDIVAQWTGLPVPLPIRNANDFSYAVDRVYRLIARNTFGELLYLSVTDEHGFGVWIDVPERGGWALTYDYAARPLITRARPPVAGEPEIDIRYCDAWNHIPASSFIPSGPARAAAVEFVRTRQLRRGVPWQQW